MNRAPSIISASALKDIPIVIKDYGLYLDFMLIITDLADDFADFLISDYEERSKNWKKSYRVKLKNILIFLMKN